jgi:FMN phosphatase YigB (HAD superfamily)
MPKVCLVIDLDDTLYDAEAAYAYALRAVGIDPFSADFAHARQTIKSRLGEGHVGARNRILYFKQFLDNQSKYSHPAVLELIENYEKYLSDHIKNQWELLGRRRLFEQSLNKIPKVIVTNENLRTQMVKLRAIDPTGEFFPHVITSEEMGVEKPHLSLFQQAIKILNCEPKDCVMVGDSLDTDMAPALRLGMRSFLTTEFRKPKDNEIVPERVQVLNCLDQLKEML